MTSIYPPPIPARRPLYQRPAFIIPAVVTAVVLLGCCGISLILGMNKDKTPASFATNPAQAGATTAAPAVSVAQPTEAAGPATVKLGQPIAVGDRGGAQVKVVATKFNKKVTGFNEFTPPQKGQYSAVMVEVTAVKGPNDIGPSNFRYVAADGTVFRSSSFVVGVEPQLESSTTIQEGQKKSGWVVFDVTPDKAGGGKVELLDDRGVPAGYWTV